VFIAIFLRLSVPITGLVVLAVVLAVATAVGVYDCCRRWRRSSSPSVMGCCSSKVLLWGGVGLMLVTVGAIALSVASKPDGSIRAWSTRRARS
jgi:hypothetical protein